MMVVVGSNIYEDSLAIEFILCGYQTIIRICTLYSGKKKTEKLISDLGRYYLFRFLVHCMSIKTWIIGI